MDESTIRFNNTCSRAKGCCMGLCRALAGSIRAVQSVHHRNVSFVPPTQVTSVQHALSNILVITSRLIRRPSSTGPLIIYIRVSRERAGLAKSLHTLTLGWRGVKPILT